MRRNSKPEAGGSKSRPSGRLRDSRVVVRAILGCLLAANMAAALFLFKPWGGSPEDLERRLGELRAQVSQGQTRQALLKTLVEKVEQARTEGDTFMGRYFTDRRAASSTILSELDESARKAGIKPKEHAFGFEPVEGSEALSMMTISANYEGSYANLVKFVNLLDRSERFLIVEQMQASPQQAPGTLNVNFKMNTFVSQEAER